MNNTTAKLAFSDSGSAIPVEQRPLWRLSVICCSIQQAERSNQGISLNKVRVFCWMGIRKHLWADYFNYIFHYEGEKPRISVDKSTDRAIELGLKKNFFTLDNGKLCISKEGELLLKIINDNDLFIEEMEFFSSIKSKLTEKMIKSII